MGHVLLVTCIRARAHSPITTSAPSQMSSIMKKKKTSQKTFFGCNKCRKRRVRCDLARPSCQNCLRANTTCPGYDITLCWLSLPKFTASGDLIPSLVAFRNENRVPVEDEGADGYARRRLVGFVRWERGTANEPYDTYEDIDQDLMILNNSQGDENVERKGQTKLLGPFGVFRADGGRDGRDGGRDGGRGRRGVAGVAGASGGVISASSGVTSAGRGVMGGVPGGVPGAGPVNGATGSNSAGRGVISSASASATPASTTPLPAPGPELWLSNELRDDALLTAAALNGDSHLLDFNVPLINDNLNYSNPNDFLSLLFHRNTATISTPGGDLSPRELELPRPHDLAVDLPHAGPDASRGGRTMIDPTNQHLYYSNYNNYFYDNPYKQNENLEIHLHASDKPTSGDDIGNDSHHVTKMPSSIMNIVQNPLQPKLGFHLLTPSLSIGLPNTALQIQPLTRYLLNHYVTHVADLMTVLPLTESPWKNIYFPRALMAIGELGALGTTSTAKNALLNALLAVLAFNLQSKFPKNSDSMKYYLNLGISLRNQASLFIRKLLGSSKDTQLEIETCLKNEKYKDVLCAVMSMISVDLVWGTMQDTNFYIRWCGRVINTKMQHKTKLSPKAKVLHRIFLSLKIIQDSTCLDINNIRYDYKLIDEQGYDINGENFITNNSIKKDTPVEKNQPNPTPQFINKKLINTKHHNENFATDALYGLPNSLIKLFASTVRILRRKIYNTEHTLVNEKYLQEVQELATSIASWELDWKLFAVTDGEKKFYSSMHEVTYHHIMSFYYGLSIYFNRLIKEQNASELQDMVKETLHHLNSIQSLLSREDVGIIPLFWQGFIAGCEAITPQLQAEYKKWGADIAQYLGSYWGARQIMLEVWRRKRLNLAQDNWVGVINDWEMNLMLN